MTTPISASLTGALSGATNQGALTGVDLALSLDSQNAHIQIGGQVPTGGAPKSIALPSGLGAVGDVQNFFLLKSDQPLDIELNSDPSLVFTIRKQNGCILFVGAPEVTDVQLTNNGSNTAKWHLTAIYGPA